MLIEIITLCLCFILSGSELYIFFIFLIMFFCSVILVSNHSVIKLDVIEHKRSFDQLFSQCSISTVFVCLFFLSVYYYLFIFQLLFFIPTGFFFCFVKNSCWWCFLFCGGVFLGEICAIFLIIELTKIMNWFLSFLFYQFMRILLSI